MSAATPIEIPPIAPTTLNRSSRPWYWLAGTLALTGVTAAIALFAVAALRAIDEPAGFARAGVPGEVEIRLDRADGQVVYVESEPAPPLRQLGLSVTDTRGVSVPVVPYTRDLRYDVPGSAGVVATAIATFHPTTPGTYRVTATGDTGHPATLAVGADIARDLPGAATRSAVALLVGALLATAVALVGHRRMRRETP